MSEPATKAPVPLATASYDFDLKSQARGFDWNWRIKVTRSLFCFVAGYSTIALGILFFFLLPKWSFPPFLLIVVGSIWAFRYNYLWWQFRRSVTRSAIYQKKVHWHFFEEGRQMSTGEEFTNREWMPNDETYTTPDGFLFYLKTRCLWIPRSSFISEAEARLLEDLLVRKTTNQKL